MIERSVSRVFLGIFKSHPKLVKLKWYVYRSIFEQFLACFVTETTETMKLKLNGFAIRDFQSILKVTCGVQFPLSTCDDLINITFKRK